MRPQEARFLAQRLLQIDASALTPCLNLGSSTREFREQMKPHIQREFIAPLERHGVRFVHVDMKPGDGIDISGDLFDPEVQARIRAVGARALVLTNVLEHVRDREGLARLCTSLVAPGSHLIVSVPRSYPYHGDPIDTMFRPAPEQLAALFPGFRIVAGAVIDDGSFLSDLRAAPRPLWRGLARALLRAALPFYKPKVWLNAVHRLTWLARPYRVSCVILERQP